MLVSFWLYAHDCPDFRFKCKKGSLLSCTEVGSGTLGRRNCEDDRRDRVADRGVGSADRPKDRTTSL